MDLRYFICIYSKNYDKDLFWSCPKPHFFLTPFPNFLRAVYIPYRTVYMFKEMNTFIKQGCINLIKSDSK